jgi:hypothetical protein
MFKLMQNDGVRPDISTFNHLLAMCERDTQNGFAKAVMVCVADFLLFVLF